MSSAEIPLFVKAAYDAMLTDPSPLVGAIELPLPFDEEGGPTRADEEAE